MSLYRSGAVARPRRGRRRRPGLIALVVANAQASNPGWLAAVTALTFMLVAWSVGAIWLAFR